MEKFLYFLGVAIVAVGVTVGVTACTAKKNADIKEATITQEIEYPNGQYVSADEIAEKAQQKTAYAGEAKTYYKEHQKDFVFEPNLTQNKFEDQYVELRESGKTKDEAIEAIRNKYWTITYFDNEQTLFCSAEDGSKYYETPTSEEVFGVFGYCEEVNATAIVEKYNEKTELKDVMYLINTHGNNEDLVSVVSSISNFTEEKTAQMKEREAALSEEAEAKKTGTSTSTGNTKPDTGNTNPDTGNTETSTKSTTQEAKDKPIETLLAPEGKEVHYYTAKEREAHVDDNNEFWDRICQAKLNGEVDGVSVEISVEDINKMCENRYGQRFEGLGQRYWDRTVPFEPGTVTDSDYGKVYKIGSYVGPGYYGGGLFCMQWENGDISVLDSKSKFDEAMQVLEENKTADRTWYEGKDEYVKGLEYAQQNSSSEVVDPNSWID